MENQQNQQVTKNTENLKIVEKSVIAPLLKSVNLQQLAILVLVLSLLILIIGSVLVWIKKPDQIIVKENANGVVELIVNERSFGDIIQPSMKTKGESDEIKVYLAKQFSELAYAVNPETRIDQLKKLLNWFPDDEAKTRTLFSNAIAQIKNDPNTCMPTALEVSQGWFATVSVQEAKLDATNKNLVNVLLVQKLQKRTISNEIENRQLSLQLEMTYLGVPTEENFMTGYAPKFVQCRVLPSVTPVASPTTAAPSTAPTNTAATAANSNQSAPTTVR